MNSISRSLSTFLYLTLAFSTFAHAVTLLPSAASDTFPECGLTCTTFTEAETGCVPPAAPVTNQATYVSCFCQSSLLTTFRSSADGTCDTTCTKESDRKLLQEWYLNYCKTDGSSSDSSSTTSKSSANSSSNSTSAASTADASTVPKTWWDGHYQWIIMVIILAIGFTAIAVLGVWLKRRHDAKYPNLYHAAASGASSSSVFANRNHDSSAPGPVPAAVAANQQEPANTDSIASSSRTIVAMPKIRSIREPSRLQKTPPEEDEIEVTEVPR
ncbi:hypothetical protein P175DRAFT_0432066 [Aspergillus ochraceoroseus IBT 24754]|nr:uncharacterized protein P175DRAFT_0432066 [Aspergillus ochraceoroseus IBT 24754]PTU23528.1 hypothetical protein P175DRAFT_0432066 [Aspergillus ochraceoroseus IBT 24754]